MSALQAPDTSRGHHPFVALLLSNPHLSFTPGEVQTLLSSCGHEVTMRSINLILGQLTKQGSVNLKDGLFHLCGPLPLSRRERHAAHQRDVRQQQALSRSDKPRIQSAGCPDKLRLARLRKVSLMSEATLQHFKTAHDPTTRLSETQLNAVISGGLVVLSGYASALYSQRLSHWHTVSRMAAAEGGQAREETLWLNPKVVFRLAEEQAQARERAQA